MFSFTSGAVFSLERDRELVMNLLNGLVVFLKKDAHTSRLISSLQDFEEWIAVVLKHADAIATTKKYLNFTSP